MDDANIDAAVDGAILGCFYMAGQVCTASERILVHEKVHDEFVEKLVARTRDGQGGRPARRGHRHGAAPQPADASTRCRRTWTTPASAAASSSAAAAATACTVEATIVDGVTSDFLMARDETFGPVAPIMTFGDRRRGDRDRQRDASTASRGPPITSSLRNAFLLGEGIKCGTVLINESNNNWDQLSPFGGRKKSGLGRELSDWMLDEVTEVKQINIDIAKVRQ